MKKNYTNAILITIDSLRADSFFNNKENFDEKNPFYNHIKENCKVYKNAYSNGAGTPSCFPSILTSTYPLMYDGYKGLSKKRITLAEILKNNDFFTAGISNNAYLSEYFGYNRGFDFFIEMNNNHSKSTLRTIFYKLTKIIHKNQILLDFSQGINSFLNLNPPYIEADEMKTHINKIINEWKKNQPFFLWMHYMDPHLPYFSNKINYPFKKFNIRKNHLKLWLYPYFKNFLSKKNFNQLNQLYNLKIKFLEKQLTVMFNYLESKGLLDNTIVIITADHGEEFLEHGDFMHPPKLYEELTHVPLLVYSKNINGPIFDDRLVEHLDIAPTILRTLGIKPPYKYIGNDILNSEYKKDYIISEVAQPKFKLEMDKNLKKISIKTLKYRFIKNNNNNHYELYNSIEDPKETKNIAKKTPEVTNLFIKIVNEHEKKLSILSLNNLEFLKKELKNNANNKK